MRTRRLTGVLLIAGAALYGAYDVFVAANSVDGDTISEVVLSTSMRHPALAFAIGFVCGHLFWPQNIKEE